MSQDSWLHLQAAEVREAIDEGRPLRVDEATLHRWHSGLDWRAGDQLGERLVGPVPVAEGDEWAVFPPTPEECCVATVLWARGEPVASFKPYMVGRGSECRVGPLPIVPRFSDV